jgi:hypothetical protein
MDIETKENDESKQQAQENGKVGRPSKYSPSMIKQIAGYIKDCPDTVPSLCGLAMELNVCKRTINRWKSLNPNELDPKEYAEFDEFLHMLGVLHDFQERTALNSGAKGDWNSVIAKLVLAKHGYSDTQNLNIGGQQSRPIIIKTFENNDNNSNE